MIQIIDGIIYVDKVATVNAELIGLALLDAVEGNLVCITTKTKPDTSDIGQIFDKWPVVKIPKNNFISTSRNQNSKENN